MKGKYTFYAIWSLLKSIHSGSNVECLYTSSL